MKILPDRPYYSDQLRLEDYPLRGIYVGGCVHERNAWGIWDGVRSHAHNHQKNEWFGWICILDPKDVLTPSGKITATLAHELAHILCPDSLHTRKWKRTVTEMGFAGEIERCGLRPL